MFEWCRPVRFTTDLSEQVTDDEAVLATFEDYAAAYFLDEAATGPLLANAKKVAAAMLGPKSRQRDLRHLVTGDAPPSRDRVTQAIDTAFRSVLGRGATAEESARFHGFYDRSRRIGGRDAAARSSPG